MTREHYEVIICDVCQCEVKTGDVTEVMLKKKTKQAFDLCPDCVAQLVCHLRGPEELPIVE